MAQHGRDNDQARREQAARASAMVSARKDARAQGGPPRPSVASSEAQDYPKNLGQFIMRNLLYILSAVAVVAVFTLIFVIAAPLSSSQDAELDQEEAYVSPYDWTRLNRSDGHYSYVVDGEAKSRLGIDVSENQHEIDWDAVAADGIEFAMIRIGYRGATEGALYLDSQYWANMDGAREAGIDCGVYFFSQATTAQEAEEEAEFVLEYLGDAELAYPIAFDSEEKVQGVTDPRTADVERDEMTAIFEAFCNRIEQAGYPTLVYGNGTDLSRYIRANLEGHPIWWAEYDASVPTAKIDITMWQYTNKGTVDGIEGAVDMNLDLSHVLG